MSLRVSFNTWSGAFFSPGGGEVQLTKTFDKIGRFGVDADLFDQWKPNREIDVFHQFSIQSGVEYPMLEYKKLGKKIALSTILWAEYPKTSEHYWYLHRILNIPDILYTNSDLESQKLSRAFDVDLGKFHRTVNGVSDEYLTLDTAKNFREEYNVKGNFILSVANIDERKNTKLLLEACRQLNKQLITIGHVRSPDYYEKLDTRGVQFRHLGPITDTEVLKSAYQQCELFALPSLCETPGIAALEAGSQGAKVAVTSEGAATEYFGDLATYLNPLDLNDIVHGLEIEISTQRNASSMRAHVTENYTWTHAAEQCAMGYRKTMAKV